MHFADAVVSKDSISFMEQTQQNKNAEQLLLLQKGKLKSLLILQSKKTFTLLW